MDIEIEIKSHFELTPIFGLTLDSSFGIFLPSFLPVTVLNSLHSHSSL